MLQLAMIHLIAVHSTMIMRRMRDYSVGILAG